MSAISTQSRKFSDYFFVISLITHLEELENREMFPVGPILEDSRNGERVLKMDPNLKGYVDTDAPESISRLVLERVGILRHINLRGPRVEGRGRPRYENRSVE